jgi:probable HAF family extracellular repeat protein
MKKAHPYLRVSFRPTLTLFIALVLGAIALLSLGTKPAETKPPSPKPPYIVQDLGTLGGSNGVAFGINNADQVVGASGISGDTEEHAFLWANDGDPNTDDMKDLGTLGGSPSQASAINEAGRVVGTSDIDPNSFAYHAFFYEDGQGMRDLGTLGGNLSDARDINNTDKVVGTSTISGDTEEHAFLYSEGVMRDLGTIGGSHSQANGINNADQVVGVSSISDTESHAYLWTDDGDPNTDDMRDLGTLGGTSSNAFAINDADKVVGRSSTSGNAEDHAFLWADDGDPNTDDMKDLGTLPGRTLSIAYGINNADQVVGSSSFAEDIDPHPFLYSGGVMRDLNTLIPPNSGWELREAFEINDKGHIVGRGSNQDGENRAFRLVQPGKQLGPGQPR